MDVNQRALSEIYHEETKYHEHRMQRFQRQIDWDAQPVPYKEYASERKISLLRYLPFHHSPLTGEPMTQIHDDGDDPLGLGVLSRLLYFTHGVTAVLQYATGQVMRLRAAPTAGGLYPTEIYLATRGCAALDDGIYNFQSKDHALVMAWEGDFWNAFDAYCLHHKAVAQSQLLVIVTAVYQRSVWRYQERAYRRILLDTGHVLGNLVLYAPREGFSPYPIGGFVDASLNRLLFFDEAVEGVLAVVALPQSDGLDPTVTPPRPSAASRRGEQIADLPTLQRQLHQASSILSEDPIASSEGGPDLAALEGKYAAQEAIALPCVPLDLQEALDQTVLSRRSTRAFTGEALFVDEIASLLGAAYLPCRTSPRQLFAPALLETYLVVQKVIGLPAGTYYYAPQGHTLRCLMAGDFRAQAWHFCLGQDLAKDAAVLVIHVAHLKTALDLYGDRAYRYLHLDAGLIGQRLNLAAIRRGLGVSGIGGFYDDEVNGLLGLSLDRIILYITTLGRPRTE